MTSVKLVRYGGLAAMLGGVVWMVDNRLVAVFGPASAISSVPLIIAEILIAVGLLGLHALQRGSEGWIGRSGFYLSTSGVLAQIVGVTVFLAGSSVFDWRPSPAGYVLMAANWLAYPVGYVLMLVGLMVYGIATVRAKILPRWCGPILILFAPLTLVIGDLRGILFGLLWVALGFGLWSSRMIGETSRVR